MVRYIKQGQKVDGKVYKNCTEHSFDSDFIAKMQIYDNTLLFNNDVQLCVHHVRTKGMLNLHEMG